jgi:hypothetical protein
MVPRSNKELQKRVKHLRNRELEAQKSVRLRTWCVKKTTDKGKPSADISMVFILPAEFKAPSRFVEEGSNEEDLGEVVA